MWEVAFFGLKQGQELGNRAAYTHQEFPGEPHPPPTPVTYQVSKRNALSYTTRKLVPILRSSNYLQVLETTMGTHKMSHKMSLGNQGIIEQLFWKRYIDDVFSLLNTSLDKIES